jgi:hypothetical protein
MHLLFVDSKHLLELPTKQFSFIRRFYGDWPAGQSAL